MGGPGSGTGTKRPDHATGTVRKGLSLDRDKQVKHQKSLFSNKPDPSCHSDKRIRDVAKGLPDTSKGVVELGRMRCNVDSKGILREDNMDRRVRISLEARDLQDLSRELAPKAMETLVNILDNPESADTAKLAAAQIILDRGYGKPAATMNLNTNLDSKPAELDDTALAQRTAETLRKIEKLTKTNSESTEVEEKKPSDLRKYN